MTATLYHRTSTGWERTVLEDVWARWDVGTSHSAGYVRSDQAESLVLIPWREGLSIDPEDGILPGYGQKITAAPLKTQLPEVRIIQRVALHRPGSPLDHWEVTAR